MAYHNEGGDLTSGDATSEDVALLGSADGDEGYQQTIPIRKEKSLFKESRLSAGTSTSGKQPFRPVTHAAVLQPDRLTIREPFITLLGEYPVSRTCPNCQQHVTTRVAQRFKDDTYILALLLCCICTLFAWVPFCMYGNSMYVHYCPQCGACHGTHST